LGSHLYLPSYVSARASLCCAVAGAGNAEVLVPIRARLASCLRAMSGDAEGRRCRNERRYVPRVSSLLRYGFFSVNVANTLSIKFRFRHQSRTGRLRSLVWHYVSSAATTAPSQPFKGWLTENAIATVSELGCSVRPSIFVFVRRTTFVIIIFATSRWQLPRHVSRDVLHPQPRVGKHTADHRAASKISRKMVLGVPDTLSPVAASTKSMSSCMFEPAHRMRKVDPLAAT